MKIKKGVNETVELIDLENQKDQQKITILKKCGWTGNGDRPRFNKPDEQGNGLRSMLGIKENDKPVINEAS